MTGRILVVDDVATNRIVMKVKLSAACYDVLQADCGKDALEKAKSQKPDLILLDVLMPDMNGVTVCEKLKEDPETADIPVIMITAMADRNSKMRGLEKGADDFLTKPVDEIALLARVRSLLRARDIQRELRLREETCVELGFAEEPGTFEGPGKIALIAPDSATATIWKQALESKCACKVKIVPREDALSELDTEMMPDVFVIAADLASRNDGLRLLSDLRSRPSTRHAATLMILPNEDSERAAIALDLGAGDILYEHLDADELAVRIKTQLRRKRQSDQLRSTVQAGLELAVTDSLTGLHNRRYALHHLDRMLGHQGRGLAVMMLDLDFFKQVNDRHGHAAGDAVLVVVAERLRAQLRRMDLLARIGGEEFLVALPDTDRARAIDVAERLRIAVGGTPVMVGGKTPPIPVTLSIGIALAQNGEVNAKAILTRADRALYGSKSEGRNLVTLATSSTARSAAPFPASS
ncbi:diguanylate cyclase [Rhodophyticola sp. CCM32]|uniref:diguanylate cyclase n=1 Tax=Rhodophyticola sp. CCM32 TaxID=2916397 RepID=UPI00107EF8C3|nr:diguanylate cyclase [Rhodophyticola sp. CCM32]QBY01415.1 diguanylate cyclase [Rhodophyticola sp. CCM32]